MRHFLYSIIGVVLSVSLMHSTADAIPIVGTRTVFFHEHEGTGNSITLEIGGETYQTGIIAYTLDLTNPANSFETFDYDTLTVHEESDLLVMCPLFNTLGIDPVKVHVVESGTFAVLSPVDPAPGEHSFVLETDLTGTVVVPPGSMFTGWTWTNTKKQKVKGKATVGPDGEPEGEISWEKEISAEGTATDLSGTMYAMTFEGTGRLEQYPVPEPSTMVLFAAGLGGIVCVCRKRLFEKA